MGQGYSLSVKAFLYHGFCFFFFTAKLSLSMFEAFRLSVMSSCFVRFKSSFRYDMIVVLKKCYSAQQWCADIELVMEAIPVL